MLRETKLGLVALLCACTTNTGDLALDEAGEDPWESRRRRMDVRVMVETGQGTIEETMNAETFAIGVVVEDCIEHLKESVPEFTCTFDTVADPQDCEDYVCVGHLMACASNRLLELARTASTMTFTDRDGQGQVLATYKVAPQSTATNAGLNEFAAKAASLMTRFAAAGLQSTGQQGCDQSLGLTFKAHEGTEEEIEITYGESLANSFVEGYYLVPEAAHAAVRDIVAVADADLSENPSLSGSLRDNLFAPVLSRGHALRLLTGGTEEPFAAAYGGEHPCEQGTLTSRGSAARDIIEEAGMKPADLFAPTDIADVFEGTGSVTEGGVQERLTDVWGYDLTTHSFDDFAELMGLERRDFEEAREWMRREHVMFARDDSVVIDRPLAGSTSYYFYASTSAPAFSPPPEYFAALGRQPEEAGPAPNWYVGAPGPTLVEDDGNDDVLAYDVDFAVSMAYRFVDAGTLPADVLDPLAQLLAQGVRDRPGRIDVEIDAQTSGLTLRLQGDYSGSDVVVVTGASGLSCALAGHVEGVACDLADYDLDVTPTSDTITGGDFAGYVEWTGMTATAGDSYFLVARKPGGGVGEAGAYESVGGVTLPETLPGGIDTWKMSLPVIHGLNEVAGSLVTPSAEDCRRPVDHCLPLDQRIPLEDELTDDGSATESSWRHYLDMARRAADEADHLGEMLISSGLDMDIRAESALDELEDICGAAIDPSSLMPGPGTVRAGACPCADGYACIAGECILDPVAQIEAESSGDPDMERLRRCLGDQELVDFVSLGTRPVCIWQNSVDPNSVCAGATAENPCPVFADESGACGHVTAPTMDDSVKLVDTKLGYFHSESFTPSPGGEPPCDALRILRDSDSAKSHLIALYALRDSGYFEPNRLRAIASQLEWQAEPEDYSRVLLNGTVLLTTGNVRDGAHGDWPCSGTSPVTCDSDRAGLYCTAATCSTGSPRAAYNDRLARAVLAAKITTGASLDGFTVPFYPSHSDSTWWLREPTQTITSSGGTALRYSGQGVRWQGVYNLEPGNGHVPVAGWCRETGTTLWHSVVADGSTPVERDANCSTGEALAFFNYGSNFRGSQPGPAAAELWGGMGARPRTFNFLGPVFSNMFTIRGTGHVVLEDRIVFNRETHGDAIKELTQYWAITKWSGSYGSCEHPSDPDHWEHCKSDLYTARRYERMWQSNLAAIAPDGLTTRNLLDGMELLCEAGRVDSGFAGCDFDSPPTVTTTADLPAVRDFMQCVGNHIERQGELLVFENIPKAAIEGLVETSGTGAYPANGGRSAQGIARIRRGLLGIHATGPAVAMQIRQLGNDLDRLRIAFDQRELREERADLALFSTISNQAAACASSFGIGEMANPVASAVTCANAAAQTMIAMRVNELENEELELATEGAIADFQSQFFARLERMQSLSLELRQAQEDIDAGLAELESLRRAGERALARALFLDTDAAGRHYHVNTVFRRRHNTLRERYLEAFDNAVKMAQLAKLGIEQRLGMKLSEMREPMSLVEAPASWESTLCTSTGIDYARIRDATDLPEDNYADAYIGDYVRRLERVVESYRLDFPFHESADTSVVSLRDELHNVRRECSVEVRNLLYHAGELRAFGDSTIGLAGWEIDGCQELASEETVDCIGVVPVASLSDPGALVDTGMEPYPLVPLPDDSPDFAGVEGFRLFFGPESLLGAMDPDTNPLESSLRTTSRFSQLATLPPGRYQLSWYAFDVHTNGPPAAAAWTVESESPGTTIGTSQVVGPLTEAGWPRYYQFLDVPGSEPVDVRLSIYPVPPSSGEVEAQAIDIAAPMLTDVTGKVVGDEDLDMMLAPGEYDPANHLPLVFVDTGETRTRELAVCEDTTGDVFRGTMWTYGCAQTCAEGFGRDCSDSRTQRCYWQTSFSISPHEIERGRIIHSGGFALGNFNYRIDSLALNFVGTEVRDCSEAPLSSSCYGGGYVPYSIKHVGPYNVRNHEGDESYEAPLFTGNIEHARGLAAERYITNPLSSADRALIEPYLHREFRGRPITGTYILRVWDEPALRFDRLEDIQIVLNYGYWTRFE